MPSAYYAPHTNIDATYAFGGSLVVDGCTAEETARKLARRCLRFETVLANTGRGPFEIAYRGDAEHGGLAAHQRIYRADGTRVTRYATTTEYHPTHAHFHIKDVYLAKLWRVNKRNRAVGKRPIARSDKNGFCPEDTRPVGVATSPGRRYQCLGTTAEPDSTTVQVVGVSAGWADVYPHTLPDQFIEITGVKNGDYIFELAIDPHDYFAEASETDNRGCVLIRLADDSAYASKNAKCPTGKKATAR